MEQFFTSLNKRQTMLLLTAATFGGSESIGIFDHLPDEEGELLKHRAEELGKIPRDRRIPLLVQEIKRLVTARRGQLWSADPERLAAVLKRERPVLIEVILRALPQATADAVRKHLGPDFKGAKLNREVKPQILHIVRWKMEEALTRSSPRRPAFKFSDVLLLKSREVLTLCDRLGARALAQALAGLSEADRDAFFARLQPDQRQIAAKAATAAAPRALVEADARQLLASYGAEKDPGEALRSAGAQRLARASLAQSPEFAARLVERHPGALGQLLLKWVREERPKISGRADFGRTDVVQELEKLEHHGIIDKPVRLPPPPKLMMPTRNAASSSSMPSVPGDLPGGKLVPPRPRSPASMVMRGPGDRPSMANPPVADSRGSGAYRDPIAERQARRAGVPPSRTDEPGARRDPIAEREARRAGAMSSHALPPVPDEPSHRPPSRAMPSAADRGSRMGMPTAPDRGERSSRVGQQTVPERGERSSRIGQPPVSADRASRVSPPVPEAGDRGARPPSRSMPPVPDRAPSRMGQPVPPSSADRAERAERGDRDRPPAPRDPAASERRVAHREHKVIGLDTARRVSQEQQSEERDDPPTNPVKPLDRPPSDRASKTSVQRPPRPPGRGPKGNSG